MHVIDDTDDRIRELCQQIAEEHDPDKVNEMCATLRHLLQVQHDTTKLRLQNIAMRFGRQMRSAPALSFAAEESDSRLRALLSFLGLASGNAA
jgi:lantibiotic modifying enzyme